MTLTLSSMEPIKEKWQVGAIWEAEPRKGFRQPRTSKHKNQDKQRRK